MRIAVEVDVFSLAQAGMARYLRNMLSNMMTISPESEFVLYAPRPVDISLPNGNWRLRTGSGLRSTVSSYWVQTECARWLAEDRIDVFWGQNHMLPLKLRRRCRRLLTIHDLTGVLLPWTMPWNSRLMSQLYFRKAARAADFVIADSEATACLTHRYLGVELARLRVVYPGVEEELHTIPFGEASCRVAERFGLSPGYLLTVGTIEPRKDHITLLRALELVPDAPQLVIVGSLGWKYRPILKQIRAMERRGRIRYLGRVEDNDLPALYSASKLMVYPSLYEGFGLPVLEAMACGCPVLCSWSSSLPEVGGSAARYFRTHDVQDLTCKLQELLANDALLEQMAVKGLQQAKRFSFRKAAAQVLGLIEEGLKRGR